MVEGKTRISVCVGGGRAWGLVMSNLNEVPYWSCYRDPHRCGWLFDLMTGFLLPDSTSHPLPVHSSTICCWKKNLSGLWKQRFVTVVTLWSSALSREPITVVTPCVQSSEALSLHPSPSHLFLHSLPNASGGCQALCHPPQTPPCPVRSGARALPQPRRPLPLAGSGPQGRRTRRVLLGWRLPAAAGSDSAVERSADAAQPGLHYSGARAACL